MNSYHIRLNNLEFHRSSKEISQKYPHSSQLINTSVLSTHLLPRHSPSPISSLPAVTSTRKSRTSTTRSSHAAGPSSHDLEAPSPVSSHCEEMAINFNVPEVNPISILFFLSVASFTSISSYTQYFSSFLIPQT